MNYNSSFGKIKPGILNKNQNPAELENRNDPLFSENPASLAGFQKALFQPFPNGFHLDFPDIADRSRPTDCAARKERNPARNRAARKLYCPERKPTRGGIIRNPRKPMPATMVIAAATGTASYFPTRPKQIGTIAEVPKPTKAQPPAAITRSEKNVIRIIPAIIRQPASRIITVPPHFRTNQSAVNRLQVTAVIKTRRPTRIY